MKPQIRTDERGSSGLSSVLVASSSRGAASRKEGVAIILVLGLMATLMLAAVAFSISMRIERRGAANYNHGVAARHMMWAAVMRAMADLDGQLDPGGAGIRVYPEWDVSVSTNIPTDVYSKRAYVLSRRALEFVPDSLQDSARGARPYWLPIRDTANDIRGRYAYVAINTSGLLDVNIAGGTNRAHGVGPQELQFVNLPDIPPGNPPIGPFWQDRLRKVRYETMQEVRDLSDGGSSNFTCFALAVEGQGPDAGFQGVDKVSLAGDESALEGRRTQIENAFATVDGIQAVNKTFIMENLLDYIDADRVPRDVGSPCTEAVPMVNEICLSNLTVRSGNSAVSGTRVAVEMLYPFVKPVEPAEQYFLSTRIEAELNNISDAKPSAVTSVVYSADITASISDPTLNEFPYFVKDDWPYLVLQVEVTNGTDQVQTTFNICSWITDSAGELVDSCPFPTNTSLTFSTAAAVPPPPMPPWTVHGVEAVDPRFNWNPIYMIPYSLLPGGGFTVGMTNEAKLVYEANTPGTDEGEDMYVSDAGSLKSVGELGRLLVGDAQTGMQNAMWKTMRLYSRPGTPYQLHNVYDKFTVTNGFRRGLVNINTTNEYVLGAVFDGCPIYGPDAGVTATVAQVNNVIAGIVADNTNMNDIADIGRFDWSAMLPAMTDLQRESFIANSSGMLTARQNTFIIVVAAQSYSASLGGARGGEGQVLATARGIAEVWRDPYRDGNGNHGCFIRFFRVLAE